MRKILIAAILVLLASVTFGDPTGGAPEWGPCQNKCQKISDKCYKKAQKKYSNPTELEDAENKCSDEYNDCMTECD